MKILFFLGFPNPFPGAAWTRIGFFAKDWSEKGHLVEVLGTFSYKTLQKRGSRKFSKVSIFNLIFHMDLNHPLVFTLNSIISFIVSTLFLLTKKPNVTIVSVPSGDAGLGALIACKLLKVKCVVDYRDMWEDYVISITSSHIQKGIYIRLKKLMVKLYTTCNLFVTVTPGGVACLKKIGLTKVKLIPNGADITIFKTIRKNEIDPNFKIVYVGCLSLKGYYRLDIVIKALELLKSKGLNNIKLFVVGRTEENYSNIIRNSSVQDKIFLLGEKNDLKELAAIIGKSDVGVVPLAEDYVQAKTACPVKFFEYCACGIPVIATVYDDSILAKLIKEHEVGLTVPSMDKERLAEAIYWIYKNKPYREKAGKRARALIEERFDRNKMSDVFLSQVEEVAHG